MVYGFLIKFIFMLLFVNKARNVSILLFPWYSWLQGDFMSISAWQCIQAEITPLLFTTTPFFYPGKKGKSGILLLVALKSLNMARWSINDCNNCRLFMTIFFCDCNVAHRDSIIYSHLNLTWLIEANDENLFIFLDVFFYICWAICSVLLSLFPRLQ